MEELNSVENKKRTQVKRKRTTQNKNTSSASDLILQKIIGEKKSEFNFGTLQVSVELIDALNKFNKEDLGTVLDEALKLIDVQKIATQYEKLNEQTVQN